MTVCFFLFVILGSILVLWLNYLVAVSGSCFNSTLYYIYKSVLQFMKKKIYKPFCVLHLYGYYIFLGIQY